MNTKSNVSLGPGASTLILIFVTLSLSALGMLSLLTGRNDLRLSERSVQVVQEIYELNERAEERRASLDAVLAGCASTTKDDASYLTAVEAAIPEDIILEDGILCWIEEDGSHMLDCALEISPLSSEIRTQWVRHNLTAEIGEDDSWDW